MSIQEIKTNINELKNELLCVKEDMKEIKSLLRHLINSSQLTTDSCVKMDKHINFVENIYQNIKSPLEYALNSVSNLSIE